jgi:hypothetical protein
MSDSGNVISRARVWLNGSGKDKVLIIWQCGAAAVILWAIVAQSISAGSFPPKKVDDGLVMLAVYGVVLWCVLALIAGVAIFLKRAWGWWLEFAIFVPLAIILLIYIWIYGDLTLNSFADWVGLFGSVMVSFFAIHGIRDLYRKARREWQFGGKIDVPQQ